MKILIYSMHTDSRGTLPASENFPKDRYLIELWSLTDAILNGSLNGNKIATYIKDTNFYAVSHQYVTL
jgi:hypothetical protein